MTVQPTRDQLRALADAATPGPWVVTRCEPCAERGREDIQIWDERGHIPIAQWMDEVDPDAGDDAAFIAVARNAVPHLLDQLDRAEHRIARLEAQTSIRGRAVVIYRERARQAEAERDEWREASAKLAASSNQANADLYEAEARIKAVRDVLDEAEASISHHPAYTFNGQRMAPIVNGADIRRALDT